MILSQGDHQSDLCDRPLHLGPLPPDRVSNLQSLLQSLVRPSQDPQQSLRLAPGLQPLLGGVALRGPRRASGKVSRPDH